MLITINILSAMSIVMALFIPYFILLHINNKLRKYSEQTRDTLGRFIQNTNENNEGQNENWKNYDNKIDLITKALRLCQQQFENLDQKINNVNEDTKNGFELHSLLHDKTIEFMESVERIVSQKQTLKEILENPIEVTKPSCETKLKFKEKVNANDIETVTKIKNKFDFECGILDFKKGYTFQKFSNNLVVHRYRKIHYRFPIKDDYTTVLWEKLLKVNEPKPKRKYTKRTIKNEN